MKKRDTERVPPTTDFVPHFSRMNRTPTVSDSDLLCEDSNMPRLAC